MSCMCSLTLLSFGYVVTCPPGLSSAPRLKGRLARHIWWSLAFGDVRHQSLEFSFLVLGPAHSFGPVKTVGKLEACLVSQKAVIDLSPAPWAGFLADSLP